MHAGGIEGDCRDFVDHARRGGQAAAERMAGEDHVLAECVLGLARQADGPVVLFVLQAKSLAEVVLPVPAFVGAGERQHHVSFRIPVERGIEAALGVVHAGPGRCRRRAPRRRPCAPRCRAAAVLRSRLAVPEVGHGIVVLEQGREFAIDRVRLLSARPRWRSRCRALLERGAICRNRSCATPCVRTCSGKALHRAGDAGVFLVDFYCWGIPCAASQSRTFWRAALPSAFSRHPIRRTARPGTSRRAGWSAVDPGRLAAVAARDRHR